AYVNPAAERSTGLKAASFLGRRLDEVGLDPDAVARFREVLATVLESGRRAFHVFDYPTRDGVRAFEARLVPEHDPGGGVASVLVIVRDLTSLRRAQAARADSESEVGRLADADRRKDEFLAVLGHELRNPLAPLRNASRYSEQQAEIRLSARVEGGDVVLSVSDSGIGIPTEVLPKVFDLFGRPGVHRPQGGLGIGLTVVKRLTEMHGGRAEAESG